MVTTPVFEHLFNIGQGLKSFDTSGNHRHSVLSGNPVWVAGRKGKAIALDGTDDAFVAPVTENVNEDFTIAFWVQNWVPGSGGAGLGILALQTASDIHASNNSLIIYKDFHTGEIKVACYDTDPLLVATLESGSTASSGFMCVRKSGLTVSFFLNGAFVDEITITELNNFDWVLVGLTAYNYTKADWIDKIRYWDSALSDEEIEYWYAKDKPRWNDSCVLWLRGDEENGSVVKDYSPHGNDGALTATLNDGAITGDIWAVEAEKGVCFELDGTAKYVEFSEITLTGEFSFTCWVKRTSISKYMFIFGGSSMVTKIGFDNNQYTTFIRLNNTLCTSVPVPFGEWFFFCLRRNASDEVYLNINNMSSVKISSTATGNIVFKRIGSSETPTSFGIGFLKDARVYNRYILDDEVSALYNRTSEVSFGCVGKWLLNEGSGSVAYDSHNRFPAKRGNSLKLDGSSEYVTVTDAASISPTNGVTVCCWTKINPSIPAQTSAFIWKHNYNFYLFFDNDFYLRFTVWNKLNVASYLISNKKVNTFTDLTFIAVAFGTDGKPKLYVNDNFEGEGDAISPSIRDNAGNLTVGKRGDGGGIPLDGLVDEVLMFNRALSATELKRVYMADGFLDYIPMRIQKESLNVKVGSVCSQWDSWDSLTAKLKRKHRSFGKKKVVSFTVIEKVADVPWLDSLAYILEDKKDSGTPVDLYIRHERKTKAEGTCVINTLKVRYDSPLTTRYIDVEVQLQ